MADIKATPGGIEHKRDQMYRDDGDGTHTEARASNLWIWNESTLAWERATSATFGGAGASTTGAVSTVTAVSTGSTTTLAANTARQGATAAAIRLPIEEAKGA